MKGVIFTATAVTYMGMGGKLKHACPTLYVGKHVPAVVKYPVWLRSRVNCWLTSGWESGAWCLPCIVVMVMKMLLCAFLGLSVEESTECVRTETTKRVFFRKKKKVSVRCTTNRMTVTHEGDHDGNRAHVCYLY